MMNIKTKDLQCLYNSLLNQNKLDMIIKVIHTLFCYPNPSTRSLKVELPNNIEAEFTLIIEVESKTIVDYLQRDNQIDYCNLICRLAMPLF